MSFEDRIKSPAFLIQLQKHQCIKCNLIKSEKKPWHEECPNCGDKEFPFIIFPETAAITLLEMTHYFFVNSLDRTSITDIEFGDKIRKKCSTSSNDKQIVELANKIKSSINSFKDINENEKLLQVIKDELRLASLYEAELVFYDIFQFSDVVDEHKATTLMACTLLDSLLDDFLIKLDFFKCSRDWEIALNKIKNCRNIGEKLNSFREMTNDDISNVLQRNEYEKFLKNWMDVRKARNKFVHIAPWAINREIAKKAIRISIDSIEVFTCLNNQYLLIEPE